MDNLFTKSDPTSSIELDTVHIEFQPEAIERRLQLDNFHREWGVETLGIGLTSNDDNNLVIHDIIAPNPENTLVLETGLEVGSMEKLINFLLESTGEIKVAFDHNAQKLSCNANERYIECNFDRLTITIAKKLLDFLNKGETDISESVEITIPNIDLEAVFYGSKVFISGRFTKRVLLEASTRNLGTDYILHHHPIPTVLRILASDHPANENEKIFQNLLSVTTKDIDVARLFNAKILEIRGLGNPSDITNNEKFTSRYHTIK